MKNADKPVNAIFDHEGNPVFSGALKPETESRVIGLTKRDHFCLNAGVPATGDEELDAIIREGERRKLAAQAMAAYVSGNMAWTDGLDGGSISPQPESVAAESINYADALLAELEKGEG